jgi:hypothetical protein
LQRWCGKVGKVEASNGGDHGGLFVHPEPNLEHDEGSHVWPPRSPTIAASHQWRASTGRFLSVRLLRRPLLVAGRRTHGHLPPLQLLIPSWRKGAAQGGRADIVGGGAIQWEHGGSHLCLGPVDSSDNMGPPPPPCPQSRAWLGVSSAARMVAWPPESGPQVHILECHLFHVFLLILNLQVCRCEQHLFV